MKYFRFTPPLIFLILPTVAAAQAVSGVVFEDHNGNGVLDRREPGISGVCVSNGEQVTVTDGHGRFVIDSPDGMAVFPVLPSGFTVAGNLPMATFGTAAENPEGGAISFPLVRQTVKNNFRIAAVGDVQVADEKELSFAARSVFSELSARDDLDFCLFPGDLVYNNTELLEGMRDAVAGIHIKSWCVPGNHDREPLPDGRWGIRTYQNLFGAGDYAFNYGQVCFIGLNNVSPIEGEKFRGFISERQKRFIGNVLRHVPAKNTVVLVIHIPLYWTDNRDEVVEILSSREKVLVLSCHTHTVNKIMHAPNICEQDLGAACGVWWLGPQDPKGIPYATQQCGSPRNYFTIEFSGTDYTLHWKGVGLDAGIQTDVWIKGEDAEDDDIPALAQYERGTVLINIFGGGDMTSVRMRVDSLPWMMPEKAAVIPPVMERMKYRIL